MTESQEFFLVVRGGGAGIDSAIFLKKSEKIKYDGFVLQPSFEVKKGPVLSFGQLW